MCENFCKTKYIPQIREKDKKLGLGVMDMLLGSNISGMLEKSYMKDCKRYYCNKGCSTKKKFGKTYMRKLKKRLPKGSNFIKTSKNRVNKLREQGAISDCDIYSKYSPFKSTLVSK